MATTALMSARPPGKTPSKSQVSLSHFSKWSHPSCSYLSQNLKCHPLLLGTPPLENSQLPHLPCCRPFSAEGAGLLNGNHDMPANPTVLPFMPRIHSRVRPSVVWPLPSLQSALCTDPLSYTPATSDFEVRIKYVKLILWGPTLTGPWPVQPFPWTVERCLFPCGSRFRCELLG